MPLPHEGRGQQPYEASGWGNVSDDWGFGVLDDDVFGADALEPSATAPDPNSTFGAFSSSTYYGAPSSPPVPLSPSSESTRRSRESSVQDDFGGASLAPASNTTSASDPLQTSLHQQRTIPTHNLPTATRGRRADYSEDWLFDQSATDQRNTFGYFPNRRFEPLSEEQSPFSFSEHTTPSAADPTDLANVEEMPPTTRRRTQPLARGGVVDLTTDSSLPQAGPALQPRSMKRAAEAQTLSQPTRAAKRARGTPIDDVEELDLTNDTPSAEEALLQQQQQETIEAQQAGEKADPVKIGRCQCIICMDSYTNATVTTCGHIFCHECLTQALVVGEKNSDSGVGNCPVCRKPVSRKKANQMIPVNFMKKSAFKRKGRQGVNVFG